MTGGHPNARHPADTRADPIVAKLIADGHLNTGEPFDIPMPTHDAANEGRLSFNRSARRQNLSPGAWVADANGEPCNAARNPCPDPESPHYLRVKLWNKDKGRGHVFRQSGGDPAKLKYNPWARSKRYSDSGDPTG